MGTQVADLKPHKTRVFHPEHHLRPRLAGLLLLRSDNELLHRYASVRNPSTLSGLTPTVLDYAASTNERALGRETPLVCHLATRPPTIFQHARLMRRLHYAETRSLRTAGDVYQAPAKVGDARSTPASTIRLRGSEDCELR